MLETIALGDGLVDTGIIIFETRHFLVKCNPSQMQISLDQDVTNSNSQWAKIKYLVQNKGRSSMFIQNLKLLHTLNLDLTQPYCTIINH